MGAFLLRQLWRRSQAAPQAAVNSQMGWTLGKAQGCRRALLALAAAGLAGCSALDALRPYDLPESPEVADAPYPELAAGPSPAELRASAPDPMTGALATAELRAEAAAAAARADALEAPVVDIGALRAAGRAARPDAPPASEVDADALRAEAAAIIAAREARQEAAE